MMRPTINEESDCLRKKNLPRRRRLTARKKGSGYENALVCDIFNREICHTRFVFLPKPIKIRI
jgi:hypothetical protein